MRNVDPYFEVCEGDLVNEAARLTPAIAGWRGIWAGHRPVGEPIAIVSRTYKLVKNEDLFPKVEVALRDAGVSFVPKYNVSHGGARSWARYELDMQGRVSPERASLVPEIVVRNSYDGSTNIKAYAKLIDNFCLNGLVYMKEMQVLNRRHTKGFDHDRFVIDLDIESIIERFEAQCLAIDGWKNKTMTPEEAREWLAITNKPESWVAKMVEMFTRESSVRGWNQWALVSALTNWATHGKLRQTGQDTEALNRMNRDFLVYGWVNQRRMR